MRSTEEATRLREQMTDAQALFSGQRDERSPRTLGRLLTALEALPPRAEASILAMITRELQAHVVAITGAPGVGKSTLTAALVTELRRRRRSVAVLAVDPSSPRTGGALLGDRVRMTGHELDPDVFIRSMSSRGSLGGISAAAPSAIRALDAAGFQTVIIETVGVGQAEVDACAIADSTVFVTAPGMGDDVQAIKAGIVELADIFVVNKGDQPGATVARRRLRLASADRSADEDSWRPPIVVASASRREGLGDLHASLEAHRTHLEATGELAERRAQRFEQEIELFAHCLVQDQLRSWRADGRLAQAVCYIREGAFDPMTIARALLMEP